MNPAIDELPVSRLLHPGSIAIVGASSRADSWPARIWRGLDRFGFPGPVYPINPRSEEVWGTRCYPSLESLPEPVDHLAILVPAPDVPSLIRTASRSGTRSATIYSGGFGEGGTSAARALMDDLQAAIDETGMAVAGPNCFGHLSVKSNVMTVPDDRIQMARTASPVAVLGQSGGIVMALGRGLEERGLAAGHLLTTGNELSLSVGDYIDFIVTDGDVKAIAVYMEAVKDVESFLAASRRAHAAGKVVVAIKAGASEASKAAAMAHTGSLVGSIEAFDAVAGQAGVVRVTTCDEVIEVVEYASRAPVPAGRGVGVITFSGGLVGLLQDAADRTGVKFGELSSVTQAKLCKVLDTDHVANPLDCGYRGVSDQDVYFACIEAMLDDPNIDLLLLQEELPRVPNPRKESNLQRLEDMVRTGARKPIALVSMISHGQTEYSESLRGKWQSLPFLQEIGRALAATQSIRLSHERAEQDRPQAIDPTEAARLSDQGAGVIPDSVSAELLSAHGIRIPRERIVNTPEEAREAAREVGLPVVLKAMSTDASHKSDVGGVFLDLKTLEEVEDAYRRVEKNLTALTGGSSGGALVAEFLPGGLELFVGVHRDPEMGPVIAFGAGGVQLELYKDVAFAPVPMTRQVADSVVSRTKVDKLISGFRGGPVYDREAVLDTLVKFSELVTAEVESMEVNPLAVYPVETGGGCVALDRLIVARAPEVGRTA